MVKTDLVDAIAIRSGVPRVTIRKMLDVLPEVFTEALMDKDDVRLANFGTFKAVTRAPRRARNMRTGTEMMLPETTVVKFVPSANLKKAVADTNK